MLGLEPITAADPDDALGVTVRPDQQHLVEPVVKSLAEAYVHPAIAWPRLIRVGSRSVGFLMWFFDADFSDDGEPDLRSGLASRRGGSGGLLPGAGVPEDRRAQRRPDGGELQLA